jgi:hypothetical protein
MKDYTLDWAFHAAYELFYDEAMPDAIVNLLTTKSDVLVAHVIADPVEYMAATIRLHHQGMVKTENRKNTFTVSLSVADITEKLKSIAEDMDQKGNTPLALLCLELVDALQGKY